MRTKSVRILTALCSCCLFASSTVARTWMQVPPPIPSPGLPYAIAVVADTDVWSVGFQSQDGLNVVLTQHWNGRTWSVVPAQMPEDPYSFFTGVIALTSRNVWAAGYSVDDNGIVFSNLIEHWDGTSWQIVPSPNVEFSDNELFSISAVSPGDIWAVGYTDTIAGEPHYSPLALHWDGTAWRIASISRRPGAKLVAVKAFASDDVWAVGNDQVKVGLTPM